jgi:DNA-binding response OmpR family regulator
VLERGFIEILCATEEERIRQFLKSMPRKPTTHTQQQHLHVRKRILIIEDEAPLVTLLKETFQEEGYAVYTAQSGKEGLSLAYRLHPDLILLDILIPMMDGLALLRRLRNDRYKWGKYVPVIILSNLSNPETIAEGTKHGVEDYLVKAEWTLEDLVRKVKEKLNRAAPSVRAR